MSLATSFMAPTNPHSLDAMLAWLENRGIDDRGVLAAMTVVPREPFVGMQAHILDVALRLQALELVGDEHVFPEKSDAMAAYAKAAALHFGQFARAA